MGLSALIVTLLIGAIAGWLAGQIVKGYGFGLGFAVRRQAGLSAVAGSTGDYNWAGAFGTFFWVDPKEQLVAVYMSAAPGPIRQQHRALFADLVLQALVD